METKPIYLSKTFWVQIIGLLILLVGTKIPAVATFLQEQFVTVGTGWAVVNVLLRLVTKGKVEIA